MWTDRHGNFETCICVLLHYEWTKERTNGSAAEDQKFNDHHWLFQYTFQTKSPKTLELN